jgi:hypothetical protein
MRLSRWGLLLCVALSGPAASARVFNFGSERVAAYLRGQYATASQGDDPFADAGGNGVTYDSEYKTNLAYEFGMIYTSGIFNWKFGFEILKPANLKDVKGQSPAGVDWYTVTNDISGYVPKLGLEINLKQWPTSRIYIGGDYGYATVTVQNSYTFTAAGAAQFPSIPADFREEIKGTGSLIESVVGFETLLSDTTTLAIDAGYRTLQIGSFSHNVDSTGFQGAVVKGDTAKNTDGTDRSLNLGGPFASVAIRIWVK